MSIALSWSPDPDATIVSRLAHALARQGAGHNRHPAHPMIEGTRADPRIRPGAAAYQQIRSTSPSSATLILQIYQYPLCAGSLVETKASGAGGEHPQLRAHHLGHQDPTRAGEGLFWQRLAWMAPILLACPSSPSR